MTFFDSQIGMAHRVAGTPENSTVSHLFEKMHPCTAGSARRSRRGEDAFVARYELAAAHEAEVPLEPRYVAEPVEGGGAAYRTGDG